MEEDVWKLLEAGIAKGDLPLSREVLHVGRIKNFYDNFTITQLDNPIFKNADYFERAAMFCAKNNVEVTTLPGYNIWLPFDKDYIMTLHNTIVPVLHSWQSKYGNNQPLRRFKTGNRYWDFNTDGMAHYGLMPDFLQDLRNIGVSPGNLTVLFRSAEGYIQMWEKTEKASGTGTGITNPVLPSINPAVRVKTIKKIFINLP